VDTDRQDRPAAAAPGSPGPSPGTGAPFSPIQPVPDGADVRWLTPGEVEIWADEYGRLVANVAGRRYEGVQPAKLFALSDPDRYVSLRDADGDEIGILRDLAGLPPAGRQTLAGHLERQYFIPVIQRVLRISEFFIDQTWTVMTDRGQREFTIQGRDSIRFLSDRAMLLMDMDDNRYLLADRHALDAASRRWVDRFVW